MSYWNFLSTYRTLLGFGLVTALSSSFGQTFFISLFLPYFLTDFGISKGDFGFLYGLATLGSALCLPYLGSRIDSLDLRRYTGLTLFGMAAAALLVAVAPHVALLGLGIVGLRLTGQGLMWHISQTVMAREFTASRGKALGIAGLGYPLGEAFLRATGGQPLLLPSMTPIGDIDEDEPGAPRRLRPREDPLPAAAAAAARHQRRPPGAGPRGQRHPFQPGELCWR